MVNDIINDFFLKSEFLNLMYFFMFDSYSTFMRKYGEIHLHEILISFEKYTFVYMNLPNFHI